MNARPLALAALLLVLGVSRPAAAEDAAPPKEPAAPATGPSGASAAAPWTTEQRDVAIPMRDGKPLAATVLRPKVEGRYPAIVVQTPYGKDSLERAAGDAAPPREVARGSVAAWQRFDRDHYAYVFVDWRGFNESRTAMEGVDRRAWRRGQDGYDVVEWVAAQAWCDGKIGTWGGSALGKQQFDTAAEHPPHLVCCAPLIAAMGQRYEAYYEGGVLLEAHTKTLDALGFGVGALVTAARRPDAPAWTAARRRTYAPEKIDVPCLFVSGWWDHFPREVIETFDDVVARGGPRARAGSRLVMGPWSHTAVDLRAQGDVEFPAAEGYSTSLTLRFFDAHLRGVGVEAWQREARVQAYQCGEDRWLGADSFAALVGAPTTFPLLADGRIVIAGAATAAKPASPDEMPAASMGGDAGTPPSPPVPPPLDPEQAERTDPRKFTYDPRDASPTIGGRNLPPLTHGPKDVARLTGRPDVLMYETAALATPIAFRGEPALTLSFACDRVDVDLDVRLCDVGPDGRAILVSETIGRAKWRAGKEQLLAPGAPTTMTLRFPPHAYTFAKDHRLALLVTGGSSPRYERNAHTGADAWDEASALPATVTILHDPSTPASVLSLPVVK